MAENDELSQLKLELAKVRGELEEKKLQALEFKIEVINKNVEKLSGEIKELARSCESDSSETQDRLVALEAKVDAEKSTSKFFHGWVETGLKALIGIGVGAMFMGKVKGL
jgi:hypothetical protein